MYKNYGLENLPAVFIAVAIWIQFLLYQEPYAGVLAANSGVHLKFNAISFIILYVLVCLHILLIPLSFLRFAGQFLCSYSTFPLYALVTQVHSLFEWSGVCYYSGRHDLGDLY